jgi:hypothetical protein
MLVGLQGAVMAQITEGGISGVVTDSTGAVLPGAEVTVTNNQTGESRQVTANEDGVYRITSLRPGSYDVKAERTGFKVGLRKNVEVLVNNIVRVDLSLETGELQEVVTITSETNLVNTEEGRVASTLTTRQVQELPINGRELYSLVLLQPGVTATLAPVISNTQFDRFNFGFSANGASPRGNNFVLDGVSNNNEWLGGTPSISPSVELVQEFQIQTVNFSAEYGRNNGSVVIAVSRTGGNQFHGSAYEFFRNDVFDARNFFDTAGQSSRLNRHQFGGSLGGPIRKDRSFFFFNYEGIRQSEAQTLRGTGETPEFRNQVAVSRAGSIADTLFRAYPAAPCVPGTLADRGSIFRSDLPLAQAKLIPFIEFINGAPDGVPDTCQVSYLDPRDVRGDQYSFRFDHHFSSDDKIFVRWLDDRRRSDVAREQLGGAVSRGFRAPFTGKFPSLAMGYTHLFSPQMLNDFRFGFIRSDFSIGFRAPASASDNFPTIFFDDGITRFGGAIFVPREFKFDNFTFGDTLSVARGSHSWKFGAEVKRIRENSNYKLETVGFYEMQSLFTFANDSPYYTEGLVNPLTGQFTETPRKFRWSQLGVFVQDDWKISRKLTLNLGLRYDYFGVPTEAQGILSNITLGSGATLRDQIATGRVGRVSQLFEPDRNNFAPRVGFAYDVKGDGNTAIRGSFAIAYLEPFSNLYTNASRFDPPDSAFPAVFPFFFGGTINYGVPAIPSTGFQTGLTPGGGIPGTRISVSGVQSDIRTAYSEQWFLGLQKKLWGPLYLTANYVGTAGKNLYIRNDINRFTGDRASLAAAPTRINQEWAGTTFVQNGGDSIYHGMNVQLQKSYGQGYMFTFNYTLGKATDEVSDPGLGDYINIGTALYTGTVDAANPRLDRGPSEFDVRHRVAAHAIWDLPSPSGPKFVRAVLGGWQWNVIGTFQTGRPFSVLCTSTITCDYNGDGLGYDRPNTPSFGSSLSGLSRSDYLNGIFQVADFPVPTFGTNGNLGRNTYRGPGYGSVDTSLFKNFKLHEDIKLQFRWEAFNLFNRTNLFIPNAILNAPTNFGRSTAAFAPRQMQFALRLVF